MTALKMEFHKTTGRRMVEVYDDDGHFVAAIYAHAGSGAIHIVSKYFAGAPRPSDEGVVPVGGYIVEFRR